jgi:hypothetical protein
VFKVLSGRLMNLVGRGAQYGSTGQYGLISSPATDAAYPLANLFDGRPASPMKFASTATGATITFPNNLVANGDFEQGTTGWAGVTATLSSEIGGGYLYKGAKYLKIVTSAINGYGYKDATVRAGEYIQLRAAAASDGANSASVRVRCLETARDLKSDGTWDVLGTNTMTKTGATMTAFTPVTFQVPSFAELGQAEATLRVHLIGSANAMTLYFDEVLLVPGFNFLGIFGHGFPASSGFYVGDSGANYWHSPSSTAPLVGTAANAAGVRQSASALAGSMQYDPFPCVFFAPAGGLSTLTTPKVPWVGEIVVGQASDLSRNPDYPFTIEHRAPNVRYATAAGSQWALPRGASPLRRVTMSVAYHSDADYQADRDAIYGMSLGGAYPLILIPTETDASEAIYGRLEDSASFQRVGYGERRVEYVLQEDALPWV